MTEGQKDSEIGEIDKGRERSPCLKKKELIKRKVGDTEMRYFSET